MPRPQKKPREQHTHDGQVKRRAVVLYASGLSCRVVARRLSSEYGVILAPQTVARWGREVGLYHPRGEPRSAKLPPRARKLYESGLNFEQVGKCYHMSSTAARERLLELGVRPRPGGSRFAHVLTEEWLRKEYLAAGRTRRAIAEEAGCCQGSVDYHLRKHGLFRRDNP